MAKANGLKVFVVDYGTDPKTVDESNRRNKKRGYVSTTLHAPLAELGSLPPYPSRPYGENPNSIISLKNVNTFAYITNSAAFGRADEFAMKMHGTNYDLLIVDVLHGRNPLSRKAVETLKFKKIRARRLVFATVNIGTAASYRFYWKANWREGSPAWIKAPVRDDPDRYHVEFWRPEWQRIIYGDTKSYVYGLITLGFDGVIMEGIEESYRFFEGGGEQEEEEPAPPPPARPLPRQRNNPLPTFPSIAVVVPDRSLTLKSPGGTVIIAPCSSKRTATTRSTGHWSGTCPSFSIWAPWSAIGTPTTTRPGSR